jgi:hypothetical protein
MMKICALQGADAYLARLTSSTNALEAPANGPAPFRAGEVGAQRPCGDGVEVGHPANGTDDSPGPERPWWRRVFGG